MKRIRLQQRHLESPAPEDPGAVFTRQMDRTALGVTGSGCFSCRRKSSPRWSRAQIVRGADESAPPCARREAGPGSEVAACANAGRFGIVLAFRAIVCLALAFTISPSIFAQDETPLAKTTSNWPGVDFEVMKIMRAAPDRVVLVVRVHAGSGAANPTFIGFVKPSNADSVPAMGPAGDPQPDPLSLRGASLVDVATQKNFPALAEAPSSPFVGPMALITSMRPNEWLQMGVQFPAPPTPPRDENGKVPEQKVFVVFPNAKLPTKEFVLPPPAQP